MVAVNDFLFSAFALEPLVEFELGAVLDPDSKLSKNGYVMGLFSLQCMVKTNVLLGINTYVTRK